MKKLLIISIAIMFYGLTLNAQSTNEAIVIDCQNHTVTPYGSSKILTITDLKLVGKEVIMSYKLENTMSVKPVLVANYTEGNIACGVNVFNRYNKANPKYSYQMSKKTIKFIPSPPDFVKGKVLVRIFLGGKKDMKDNYMAISNVVSIRMNF